MNFSIITLSVLITHGKDTKKQEDKLQRSFQFQLIVLAAAARSTACYCYWLVEAACEVYAMIMLSTRS